MESIYNRYLSLFVAIKTLEPSAQRLIFSKRGTRSQEGGGLLGGGQVQQGGGLTSEVRRPPPSPPGNENLGWMVISFILRTLLIHIFLSLHLFIAKKYLFWDLFVYFTRICKKATIIPLERSTMANIPLLYVHQSPDCNRVRKIQNLNNLNDSIAQGKNKANLILDCTNGAHDGAPCTAHVL